jgi:hypothetical protein
VRDTSTTRSIGMIGSNWISWEWSVKLPLVTQRVYWCNAGNANNRLIRLRNFGEIRFYKPNAIAVSDSLRDASKLVLGSTPTAVIAQWPIWCR